MTTQSWSSRIRNDTDANFREWGGELSDKLDAVGLVQTSDTGQADWATATLPGSNTFIYEIRRFDDADQGTAPIFIKLEYGGGNSDPQLRATVGTGTNGSGTLTGTALTTARRINGNQGQSTDTAYQSYLCMVDGFFGLAHKCQAGSSEALLMIARTCDQSDGDPTVTGAMVVWGSGSESGLTATQALRFASAAAAYTAQTTLATTPLCHNAQARANSSVGSDTQDFVAFTITPQMAALIGCVGVITGECAEGATLVATPVGATPRTYIGLGTRCGPAGSIATNTTGGMKFAMLWE